MYLRASSCNKCYNNGKSAASNGLAKKEPVPQSIFLEDGSMVSCVKSDFMHKLEGLIPDDKITSINSCGAIVYDGYTSIQMLGTTSTTSLQTTFDDTIHLPAQSFH